jgi:DNA-binding NtrC family response regulator
MNILVVDDFEPHRQLLARPFRLEHDVKCAADLQEAEQILENWWPDVALVDAIFPKKRGGHLVFAFEDFLESIEDKRNLDMELPQVILVSGQNEAAKRFEEVRQWLTYGRVADVIPKSTADVGVEFFLAVVRLRVEMLLERVKWREVQNDAQSTSEWFANLGIVTNHPKVLALKTNLIAAARSPAPVLLSGPTGCGKELFARAIHRLARRGKDFEEHNASTIPLELFETEIFGVKEIGKNNVPYVAKTGLFGKAGKGTVFLDEIQDLRPEHQPKMLKAVEERKYKMMGSNEDTPFLAKLVTATSENLRDRVERGAFREALYYRIAVFEIEIPSLDDRREDIPLLADHLVNQIVRRLRAEGQTCPDVHVDRKSRALLMSVSWKGNVRELNGVLERSVSTALAKDSSANAAIVITPQLLREVSPHQFASTAPRINNSDKVLAISGIGAARWSELDDHAAAQIVSAITERLSDIGRAEFEKMQIAIQPRAKDAREGSPGRDKQDPAAIHCLKALFYLLMRDDNSTDMQDLGPVLGVGYTQTKKVLDVLEAREAWLPRYAPFISFEMRGTKMRARIVDNMMKPKNPIDPA